ncbi:Uu.00g120690.m01.CDS01 [Anthostomella pinea]|uniref:Uu.00g120690.m01.CDS01 n=1 Tax=Anthostomella pinea TaxID=933095 RepID=A0AAI8VHU3_9PEZI|nr:Uu.00g120690.m01.CDS01 [Anthostomella pinea]
MTTLFCNGRFFQSGPGGQGHTFAECMLVDDEGQIVHVGSPKDEKIKAAGAGVAVEHDMAGHVVLPGFIDGHMHLLMLGQSLQKACLEACQNIEDIRRTIKDYAIANPSVARIMCKGWMHSMTNGEALASMIDDLDPDPSLSIPRTSILPGATLLR